LGMGAATSRVKVSAGPAAFPAELKAIVTLGSRQYIYDGANGEDMGNYVGEFVRQRCFRVMRPDLPLTVFFRPDMVGDRVEVVFELGRMWIAPNSSRPGHMVDPYSVEIAREGTTLAKIDVPYHWWWARWRWQSAPRPVVRKPSSLMSSSLFPPYGNVPEFHLKPYSRDVRYEKPMDMAGLASDWGDTGERDEIGPVTEPQADYIINGTSNALSALLAQAEACATAPIHWRDERTGAFIDFQRYPDSSMNSHDGDPLIPMPPAPRTPDDKQDRRYFRAEPAHAGALAFVPYMLTDDPYFLEELQALGELGIGFSSIFRHRYKLPGIAHPGQTRSFAWSMRSLFQLGMVTPEKPPRWLLPRIYWRKSVADSRALMQIYMDSPARIHRYFRAFPEISQVASWQTCMLTFVLSWGVMMGYSEWNDAYQWYIAGPLAQCNGKSGWSRQWPVPYHWYPLKTWRKYEDAESFLFRDKSIDSETCLDWSDAWNLYKNEGKIDDTGWDGHSIMENVQSPSYYLYLLGSLRMAMRLGVEGSREAAAWLENEIPGIKGYGHVWEYAKWAITSP
jgi:hypothetical protein